MATPLRKTHFIIALLASWIDSLKRTVAAGGAGGVVTGTSDPATPTFTGTAPGRAVNTADILSGTGYSTAGQVVTTTETFTATLNQYAGCWLLAATKAPCLIVSHPAVTGAALAFTVEGEAPATTAEGFRVLGGPTPVGAVSAHTHGAGSFAASPASGANHYDRGEYTITAANATDLETSRTLLLAIGVAYYQHINDALAHDAIDDQNTLIDSGESMQDDFITPVRAANLATLQGLANDIKAALNAHFVESGVHPTDDVTRSITSPDATNQGTLNTLVNEIKADFNAHVADGFATPSWRVIED